MKSALSRDQLFQQLHWQRCWPLVPCPGASSVWSRRVAWVTAAAPPVEATVAGSGFVALRRRPRAWSYPLRRNYPARCTTAIDVLLRLVPVRILELIYISFPCLSQPLRQTADTTPARRPFPLWIARGFQGQPVTAALLHHRGGCGSGSSRSGSGYAVQVLVLHYENAARTIIVRPPCSSLVRLSVHYHALVALRGED